MDRATRVLLESSCEGVESDMAYQIILKIEDVQATVIFGMFLKKITRREQVGQDHVRTT